SQYFLSRFGRHFCLSDPDHSPWAQTGSHWPHQTRHRPNASADTQGKMTMRFLITALSVAAFLVSANVAKADKRVAFVVGNGAYTNVAPLPNPAIDAKSIAKLLRNVGFDVVEGANLTRDKMTERLRE